MTQTQSCKKCHGTGKVKDRSSGKRMRCTTCAGTGMVMTTAAKAYGTLRYKEIQRHQHSHHGIYEPAELGRQRKAPIHRPENYVKRHEQHKSANGIEKVARDADAKEPLVRQNISSGFQRTVIDD